MTTATIPLIETLNAEQVAAATSTAKRTLVVAPPGSGKTRVLAARLVWLLRERNMPSHNVLALVFTRAAAAELRSRVVAEVGEDLASLVTICTFHSLALSLLRSDESLGYRRLRVASEDEEKEVFSGLFGGPTKRPEAKRVGKRRLRKFITERAAGREAVSQGPEVALFLTYSARLRVRGLASHDDLYPDLMHALREGASGVRAALSQFRHVLVDEAHDLTVAELALVQACGGESTVVLDPRQAIYGWRGANVSAVLAAYADARRVDLTQTYRFGPAIASQANEIARGWGHPEILPASGADDVVESLERESLGGAVTTMAAFLGRENVAVLCRTNYECEQAAAELGDMAAVVRREESRPLRVAIAMARLVLNDGDDSSFRLLWKHDGGSEDDLRRIERESGHARSLYATARREYLCTQSLARAARYDSSTKFGWLVGTTLGPDGVALLPLQEALDALAERQDADAFAGIGDRVAVSTVHAAKGREWEGVVFCDFKPRNEEDERVRFVAVTRARRELCILEPLDRWPR